MSLIDDIKDIAEIVKKAGNLDLYKKLVETEAKIVELTIENNELKKKIDELSILVEIKRLLSYKDGAYWAIDKNKTDGPFCTKCWDVDKKAVRFRYDKQGYGRCPNCNTSYERDEASPSQMQIHYNSDY